MDDISDNLLVGAGALAEFVLKEDTEKNRRRIYYLHEKRKLPTFLWGSQVAAFKSTIRQDMEARERASLAALAATDKENEE